MADVPTLDQSSDSDEQSVCESTEVTTTVFVAPAALFLTPEDFVRAEEKRKKEAVKRAAKKKAKKDAKSAQDAADAAAVVAVQEAAAQEAQRAADEAALAAARKAARKAEGKSDEPDDELLCPITLCIMKDPVVAADLMTYERGAIEDWLSKVKPGKVAVSPMTGSALEHTMLSPNRFILRRIQKWEAEN